MPLDNVWDCKVLADILQRHPLSVVDVGAAGGIDPVWRPVLAAGFGVAAGFEPFPDNFQKLKATERIKFFPFAISDAVGTATFYGLKTIGSLNRRVKREGRFAEVFQEFEVQTETLSHLRAQGTIAQIDVLKIDVEGAELAVLRGAGEALDDVLYLKAEFSFDRSSGNAYHGIDAIAAERGLRLFDFAANYTGYQALFGGDVLYLRNVGSLLSESRDKEELKVRVAKLIAISLINNYRQYAYVCARSAIDQGLFTPDEAAQLIQFITRPVFVPIAVGDFPGKDAINRLLFTLSQLFAGGGMKKSFPRDNRLQKSPRLWRTGALLSRMSGKKMQQFWEGLYDGSKWN
jgi:FkbM family methyltransferase